ncbi:MAG: hypothetical protein ABSH21_05245 [Verrucomicrobiia bacterium]|jgi:SAM-dependent methyltransferase
MWEGQDKSLRRRSAEVFVVSMLILFLEIALIRWLSTEISILAYLGNLVLVVCFFGIGIGCYLQRREASLASLAINLALLVALVANPLHVGWLDFHRLDYLLGGFEDSPIWMGWRDMRFLEVVAGLLLMGVLLYPVLLVFVPLGQILGRCFEQSSMTIRAYSINIAGSLAGVCLFSVLSSASMPPEIWFITSAAMLAILTWLMGQRRQWWVAGIVGVAAVLPVLGDPVRQTVWSPYHRLTITKYYAEQGTNCVWQGYALEVNGAYYQHILNLSHAFVAAHPEVIDAELVRRGHYELPFAFQPSARRMLIVGAGTGNDAAAALRHGIEDIDCVEIDPQIYALGKQLHPEHPYDSPRVHMVVDDARAFFKRAKGRYDIIWFGWLDSHTIGSAYNNLRLDHFVYTEESLREAKRLLADDGVLILGFGVERLWIADRLFGVERDVFEHAPLAYGGNDIPRSCGGGGGVTLVTAKRPVALDRLSDPSLREFVSQHLMELPGVTRPTTDDWPYLYLQRARIPKLHLVTSLAILGVVALASHRMAGAHARFDWHFFALGAAFMLLEVQTVSRATLLFGMTWVVNAIVISAVLVMILLANLVTWRWPRFPQWLVVSGLAVSVALLALVPLDWFNALTGVVKVIMASAFLTAPMFFAGLIFIRSFATCPDKSQALGSNLIGALVGGLLESVSFVTGIRALVLLVGAFYVLALWLRPRTAAVWPRSKSVVHGGA